MNANNDEEDTRTRTRELMTNRVFFEVVQLVQVSLSAYRLPDLLCYGRHFLLATFYGTRRGGQCPQSQRRRFAFLRPRLLPQERPCARKRFVGEVHRYCSG